MPSMMMQDEPPTYEMLEINPDLQLKQDYRIKIIGSSIMQQSRASMLDQMIRLMQTPAEDGMPCVPREAVLDYLPDVNKRLILQYFQKQKEERMALQQQQNANNEVVQQVQLLSQQMQELTQAIQSLQSRADSEDEQRKQDEIRFQGYQQGMAESKALNSQIDKAGNIPPELLEQIAGMSNEELAELLQSYPEIADIIS